MSETKVAQKGFVIVVGVDLTDAPDLALKEALLTGARHKPAEVHVAHVWPSYPAEFDAAGFAIRHDEATERLRAHVGGVVRELGEALSGGVPLRIVLHTAVGSPSECITQLASDLEADLVVVGTHGRAGLSRLFLGSVAEAVVRLSPATVTVVRAKPEQGEELPRIAPPCPACVETRKASGGKELWCEQHRERHGRRHTYHIIDRNSSAHPNMPLLTPL